MRAASSSVARQQRQSLAVFRLFILSELLLSAAGCVEQAGSFLIPARPSPASTSSAGTGSTSDTPNETMAQGSNGYLSQW